MQNLSTKELYRLIDIINAIHAGNMQIKDIPKKDQENLNYLMDILNLKDEKIQRVRRSKTELSRENILTNREDAMSTAQGAHGEEYKTEYVNIELSTETLLRLIEILNHLQSSGMELSDIANDDKLDFNYLMDIFDM